MGTCSRLAAASMFLALLLARAPTAHAGGLEYNGAGTEAAGRGGAWAARADTPMALQLNPAMLPDLPGVQVMVNLNVGLYDACAARTGDYATAISNAGGDPANSAFPAVGGDGSWASRGMGGRGTPYPTVCNATPFSPGASIVATWQVTPDIGLGFGILSPYAAGATRYGDENGYVDSTKALPSPMRYVLVSQNLFQIFPSVGIGWRATPWLRIGATFQWGIVSIDDRIYSASNGGEDPSSDVFTKLNVNQFFEPAGILSVAVRPMPGLDIMTAFRVVSEISADGSLTLSGNTFGQAPDAMGNLRSLNTSTATINNVHLRAPQPWTLSGGIRYGMRRNELESQLRPRHRDSLATEYFDVEVDGVWEINSLVDTFNVTLPAGATFNDPALGGPASLPPNVVLPHHWRDQVSLRIGGDWNVVRDLFAIRAGFSYESNGVNPSYAQLDFMNAERFQIHAGMTFRIDDVDLSLAYIHIFQSTVDATATGVAMYPQNAAGGRPAIVNNAVYTASWNVLSLGATFHFR